MTDTKPTQKEEAFAFAKEHGFTIRLETIGRRTYYRAKRPTGSVDSQGYGSLTVRMRKHLESIGEIAPKVFPKTQSRAAFQRWQHNSNSRPRRAHYRKPKAAYRPWVVYANGGRERIGEFALRGEAVTCVRRFLSDNAIIKASVGAMEIRFERG